MVSYSRSPYSRSSDSMDSYSISRSYYSASSGLLSDLEYIN